MAKDLVNELYKFINSDKSVSFESLKEASDSAYAGLGAENDAILKEHEVLMKDTNLFTRMPEQYCLITAESVLAEWRSIAKNEAFLKEHVSEIPAGWEKTIEVLRGIKEITHPNALAWHLQDKGYKADEGTLTANLANIQDPGKEINTLAEEKKDPEKTASVKTADAGITETPEKGKLQKEMDKATPDVDKKSDFQKAAKVSTATKVEPEISGVRVGKDKELEKSKNDEAMPEGKLVADPSTISDPKGTVQSLAEERALVTVSDKLVAEDIAKKYPGGRVVNDDAKKQFVVMVQQESVIKEDAALPSVPGTTVPSDVPYVNNVEKNKLTQVSNSDPKTDSLKDAEANKEKYDADKVVGDKGKTTGKQEAPTREPSAATGKADASASQKRHDATQQPLQHSTEPRGETTTAPGKPEIKDVNTVAGTNAAKADKLTPESTIKEEVSVTVTSTDGTANVSITPSPTATTEIAPVSTEIAPAEEVAPEAEVTPEVPSDEDFTDEEAQEFAERIFVSDHLKSLGEDKLTEKQKTFITETCGKKMSAKQKEKVDKKLKALKDKKNKK